MHYYSFNPKDYMSKTAFLEPMEDLAYRRMLDHCYLTELPLPEDIEEIAMLIRMRSHSDSIKVVLHYFFELTPQGYVCERAARELHAYHSKSEKAKASAEARWEKHRNKIKDVSLSSDTCEGNANALSDQCESNANNKQLTNNHKPITNTKNNNVELSAQRESVVQIFEFWKSVFGKNASTKLNAIRERKIKQRLDDGYTIEQIQVAILNCSKSEFHIQGGHTDIELICRDNIKLDRFIEMTVAQQQANTDPWATYFQNLGKQVEVDVTPVIQEVGYVKS